MDGAEASRSDPVEGSARGNRAEVNGACLPERHRRLLVAALDRILPGAEGPGATEARAIECVSWMLSFPHRAAYARSLVFGLDFVDTVATAMWSTSFTDCEAYQQDEVLRRVHETPHPSVQRFFVILVRVTLAGFLCAPVRGGNRNGLGWQHIGFDPHPLTVRIPARLKGDPG